MNRQADYRPTEVVFTTAQEPVLEKTPEKEKPKYLTGEGHTLGVQGNKRDIVGSKEYKSDQRCQRLTEKDKCVAPCSWNESEEPHCRYEELIENVSEVAARIITDSDYISEFTESFKELKCLSASECKKTRKVIVDDTKKIEEDLKEFSKVLQKSSLLASSIDLHSEKAVRDTIQDTILAEVAAAAAAASASASATPKSSSKASSPKASSPKSSPKALSPKALSPKASPMSAATTDLLSDTHSWFSSAIASFDERREQELSEEQEKELEERENEFYKANIAWLYSDSIAQGILTVKREEEANKREEELQESLRKNNEKREKENAIAKAKQDKVDAINRKERNEMLKGYATAGWSSAMGAIGFIGKGTLGALSLTGKALSVTGKVIGSTINLGVKTGEFGLRALNTGLDYLNKSQKSKRATKAPATRASAKASAKASPSPSPDDEVVFLGETKRPNPTSKRAARVSSAAAHPPSPPPQAPTCEAIMDEEPCEGAKIGTYGCNWMDGRRPLCLQSQSNKNNEGIQQIFNQSNTESWSEAKVANYINDPTSPIYQFWRRGRNALITRWAKERHFGDNFMGTKATTNKRGYRTKGGNRKTKKRNNKK
jgi:hypothetical protein